MSGVGGNRREAPAQNFDDREKAEKEARELEILRSQSATNLSEPTVQSGARSAVRSLAQQSGNTFAQRLASFGRQRLRF